MEENVAAHKDEINLPVRIGRPAESAFIVFGIRNLTDVTKYSEKELLALHGVGPKSISILREALKDRGLSFKN